MNPYLYCRVLSLSVCFIVSGLGLPACSQEGKEDRPDPTEADARYGEFDRNVLDFWKAPSASPEKPAPVLIYYHGGGWLAGDKKTFNPKVWLSQGISVVSVNYRFTAGHKDAAPYPAPMEDGARALQFVRSKAEQWHIDPDRVALSGGSAGAVICLWIAYRDDGKKPDSEDPIERMSTRVTCILPTNVPTTLDPKVILEKVGGSSKIHPAMLPFWGIESLAELQNPEKAALLKDSDPFTHISADDPPTYCLFTSEMTKTPLPADTDFGTSIHHPKFGVLLKEQLDAVGVDAIVQWKGDGKPQHGPFQFLLDHLKPTPTTP